MAITQDQINQFTQKARAKKYTEEQIAAEIARKQQETSQPAAVAPSPTAPTAPTAPTQPEPQKGGLFDNIKNVFGGLSNLVPATTNMAKDISASVFTNSDAYKKATESNMQAINRSREITKKAAAEKDPLKKKQLLTLARDMANSTESDSFQPEFSKDINKNYVERGLAVGSEIAPLIMNPSAGAVKQAGWKAAVGRVGSMAAQGAEASGVRGLFSLDEMTPEERLKRSLTDAGWGALVVGGLQGAGEVVGGLASSSGKAGKALEKTGSTVRQNVRKVRQPAGVWSASKEEAINGTLDKMGISGSAGEQYKQLQPAYDKLSKEGAAYLKAKKVPVVGVADDVAKEVPSVVRKPELGGSLSGEDALVQAGIDSGWVEVKDIKKLTPSEREYLIKSASSSYISGDPVIKQRADFYTKAADNLSSTGEAATKDLTSTIKKNLDEIPGDVLAEAQGTKEYEKIAKEAAKVTDSEQLFKMKQWLNGRLGRVYDKMEKGNPLTPQEEVLLSARDTVDSELTRLHPELKELTMAQSHLRDAAPSLAKARMSPPTQRIAGTSVPEGATQKGTDMVGAGMQKAGMAFSKASGGIQNAMDRAGGVAKMGQTFVNKATPFAVDGSFASDSIPDISTNSDGSQSQPSQNQQTDGTNNQGKHEDSLSQKSITGHTVDEHLQALSKATAAGDKKGVAYIKQQLAIEQEYAKMHEGKDNTQKEAMMDNAKTNVQKMKELYGLGTDKTLSIGKSSVGLGGVLSKTGRGVQKAFDQDYVDRLTAYQNMSSFAAGLLNQARGAGVLNAGEYEVMQKNMPNEYTTEKAAGSWFTNMDDILNRMNSQGVASYDPAAQLGGFAQ